MVVVMFCSCYHTTAEDRQRGEKEKRDGVREGQSEDMHDRCRQREDGGIVEEKGEDVQREREGGGGRERWGGGGRERERERGGGERERERERSVGERDEYKQRMGRGGGGGRRE